MEETLATRFQTARAHVVEWEGGPVYSLYEINPAPGAFAIELGRRGGPLRFLKNPWKPVQGLELAATGGTLIVNNVKSPNMVLWEDTAPRKTMVRFEKKRGAVETSVQLWNVWRTRIFKDLKMAWLGNAGMRVEQSDDGCQFLLRCSDGEGSPDFDDLQVRICVL